ncbi:MAG: pitrilysin family protein [Candidatus Marinimicrobia bacterium]|jgi:zinc protease|nr:pitrilysin family protein [Candidatus Neomarinimicrobiota bacterium]
MFKKSLIIGLFVSIFMIGCKQKADTPFNIEYEKYRLDNGLVVILHEDKSDPIVGVAINYHVGSNRETPGRTGFAHLFEHMLFEQSQHLGKEQFAKEIYNAGGTYNGGTNKDGTFYFEVVPNNALETVLWMEADRMGWLLSTVTQAALSKEQDAVQNEKRMRVDNRPYGHSNYVMIKNMYPEGHPYNWTTIGELEDLQNATLEDVRSFYENWYGPNNATMVIAGDFKKAQAKKWVKKYFGEIKRGPNHPDPKPQPATLSETKKAYHEDNFAKSPQITMAFPTVDQGHFDAGALELLSQLLGDGKKAPLYKVIVEEQKLAPSVSAYSNTQEIAGTINIVSTGFPTTNLTDLENAIHEAFARFESDGFTTEDLDRLKAKYETGFYQGISSVLSKGFQLAIYNEYYGSPDAIATELQKVLDVNMSDVKRVYGKYIKGRNYVLTSFVPKGKINLVAEGSVLFHVKEEKIVKNVVEEASKGGMDVAQIPSSFDRSIKPEYGPQPRVKIPRIWKQEMDKGITLYGAKHDELPMISLGINIKGGMLLDDPNQIGVANLVTDIMMEGTANKTPADLEEAIEALGSSINMFTTKQAINIEVSTLKRNLEPTLALVEEILFEPRWDRNEFERIKRETAEDIKRRAAVPSSIASNVFNKLNYGDHILANSTLGTVTSIESIELTDVKSYVEANFAPHLATISIVGDISRSDAINAFKGMVEIWEEKEVTFPKYEMSAPNKEAKVFFVNVPNAKQSEIRAGYLSIQRDHPDFFPATMINMNLGAHPGSNFESVLRGEKGFTYAARSYFTGSKLSGMYFVTTGVRSNSTEESLLTIKDILLNYRMTISKEDLDFSKNMELKSNARRFETLGALRGMISNIATYDLPFDYIKDQEEIVRNMTIDSHNALAKKYIRPDEMIYLVVGDAATQLEGMKSLGFGDPILLDADGNPVQ